MQKICDGDLYKIITIFNSTFELYYGYYEESDRYTKNAEPVPIYPSFLKEPRYTAEGHPFVTEMQDICPYYKGKEGEESCFACSHFQKGEELIGICLCRERMKPDAKRE